MKAIQKILTTSCFTIGLICLESGSAEAATIFRDNFSDGSIQDRMPVSWTPPWGTFSGSVLPGEGLVISGDDLPAFFVPGLAVSDVSIQTQLKWTEGSAVGISGRMNLSGSRDNYYVYVGPTVGLEVSIGDTVESLVDIPMAVAPGEQDIKIQLDLFRDSLDFWVWPANESMPIEPTGHAVDDSLIRGTVALWVASETYPDPGGRASATFRYVHVADSHIPEPSTLLLSLMGLSAVGVTRRRRRASSPILQYRLMRSTNRVYSAMTFAVFFAWIASQASAATVFRDNFSDGNVEDGMPVTWVLPPDFAENTLMQVENGSLVLEDATRTARLGVSDLTLLDTSIRIQFRLMEDGFIGVTARNSDPNLIVDTFGGIEDDGVAFVGFTPDDEVQTEFDPKNEDVVMQLDVLGEDRVIKLWMWRPGTPMPREPLLTGSTASRAPGAVWLFLGGDPGGKGAFRYVHVADSHIPEPTTLLLVILGMAGTCWYRRR